MYLAIRPVKTIVFYRLKRTMDALSPTTTYPAIVGQILANHREQVNLTQGSLAKHLGIKQSAWSKIERGATPPTIEHLARVASILNISPGKILSEADHVADRVKAQGINVEPTRIETSSALESGLLLIGAVALGTLVAAVLMTNGRNEDEQQQTKKKGT